MFGIPDYKEGDKVVCITDRLKKLSKGNIYEIDKIYYDTSYAAGIFGKMNDGKKLIKKLKLKGINGPISYKNFEPTGKNVDRDSIICDILDEESDIVTTAPTTTRKIDEVENKAYQMFELLMNRIARDRNRLHWDKTYSDFDTMIAVIAKGDRIWGIDATDFDIIKNMTISDLMTLFIKYKQKN